MSRALIQYERQSDGAWSPVLVILATPERLQGKVLPGSDNRDARLDMYIHDSIPPQALDHRPAMERRWHD